MKWRRIKSVAVGLGVVAVIIGVLLGAVRMPVMEVVRRNMQTGVDADAYFYSDVEGFDKYEEAIAEKRR
jgi:uncharacterized phosphosugar-binding protein